MVLNMSTNVYWQNIFASYFFINIYHITLDIVKNLYPNFLVIRKRRSKYSHCTLLGRGLYEFSGRRVTG